jgi:hypothetical protein
MRIAAAKWPDHVVKFMIATKRAGVEQGPDGDGIAKRVSL